MSNKETGGPAFPCDRIQINGGVVCATGMTMRDEFAKAAMQGMMSNNWNTNYKDWAGHAYLMADAMLEARNG